MRETRSAATAGLAARLPLTGAVADAATGADPGAHAVVPTAVCAPAWAADPRVRQALLTCTEAVVRRHGEHQRRQARGVGRGVGVVAVAECLLGGPAAASAQRPVLALDLDDSQPRGRRWRLWRELADRLPAGSSLLVQVSDGAVLQCLRDPTQLAHQHRRLRMDALHRPLAAAGAGWRLRGLLLELWHGQPPLALCELGLDP
jgi:hypothetical protein